MAALEDAAELRLGEEFEKETCLTNAEVAIMLQEAKARYDLEDRAVPEVFEQTLAYVNRFSQIKDPKTNRGVVEELRKELEFMTWERATEAGTEEISLRQFEVAAAINLKVDEVDEAVALIPSLHPRLNEDEIQEIIDKINRATGRTFQA